MLFTDKLIEFEKIIRPSFEQLVNDALIKQNHPGNMLIWLNNGFYNESIFNYKPIDGKVFNPHVVGPGEIGHSEQAHFRFIHQYRQAYLAKLKYTEYLKQLEFTEDRKKEIDELVDFEETTINLEMLVYIKFWESDSIIKKLYELVRICNSENYDWYFKIAESNRDNNATGNRQDLIRKEIRDKIEKTYPSLYSCIKKAYKTQIRNAIAHSKYSFQGRNIHIHNYIKEDPHSQISNITFDEWVDIFHITTVLHNEYIRANNYINEYYDSVAKKHNNEFPILITEKEGKQYELPLIYRPDFKDWRYKQT